MFKKMFISLIGLVLIVSSVSSTCSDGDDELDQQQTNAYSFCGVCCPGQMFAQSFKPTLEILTRVELRMAGWSDFHGVKVSIRSELEGEDLTSYYLPPPIHAVPQTGGEWFEFDFSDILVQPEETYYIVWDPDDGGEDSLAWGVAGGYSRGKALIYDGEEWRDFGGDFAFKTYGRKTKPEAPTISGPTDGVAGMEYTYGFTAIDPDNDNLYYYIDWGDGTTTEWIGPYESGETAIISHTWLEGGDYTIKAKVKDDWGVESNWSQPFNIHMATPTIEITEVKGGFGRITVNIRNTGDASAEDIPWSINVIGMVFLNSHSEGIIDTIQPGEETYVKSRFILGLGYISVNINVDGVSKTVSGTCIGPILII